MDSDIKTDNVNGMYGGVHIHQFWYFECDFYQWLSHRDRCKIGLSHKCQWNNNVRLNVYWFQWPLRLFTPSDSITITVTNVTNLWWEKWVCNPFCPSQCPSKRSKLCVARQCYGDGDGVVWCEETFSYAVMCVSWILLAQIGNRFDRKKLLADEYSHKEGVLCSFWVLASVPENHYHLSLFQHPSLRSDDLYPGGNPRLPLNTIPSTRNTAVWDALFSVCVYPNFLITNKGGNL